MISIFADTLYIHKMDFISYVGCKGLILCCRHEVKEFVFKFFGFSLPQGHRLVRLRRMRLAYLSTIIHAGYSYYFIRIMVFFNGPPYATHSCSSLGSLKKPVRLKFNNSSSPYVKVMKKHLDYG